MIAKYMLGILEARYGSCDGCRRTTVLGTSLRMSTATDVHMVRLVLVLILGTTLTP